MRIRKQVVARSARQRSDAFSGTTIRLGLALLAAALASCGDSSQSPRGRSAEKVGAAAQAVINATPPSVTPLASVASEPVGILPGGGAVSPNGAFTYTIPITVPTGRAGMEPKIALSYSSKAGDGQLGVGWSVTGTSMILRCPKRYASGQGLPGRTFRRQAEAVQFDNSDEFCLDGQKLLLTSGTNGELNAEYKTELDTFQRIRVTSAAPSGPQDWTVWRKDGTIATYTAMHFSRETLNANGSLSVRTNVALAYPIRNEKDRSNNEIQYTWGAQPIPRITDIRYTGCASAGACTPYPTNFQRRVEFVYDPDTNPAPEGYVNGLWLNSAFRLRHVKTWDLTRTTAGDLVLDYTLNYGTSAVTGRNLLKSVTVTDSAGVTLPATEFNWSGETMGTPDQEYQWRGGTGAGYVDPLVLRPSANARDRLETAYETAFVVLDVNGDGNDDIVLKRWAGAVDGIIIGTNGRATSTIEPRDQLFLGRGNGTFAEPVPLDPEGNGQPAAGTTCAQAEIVSLYDAIPVDLDMNGTQELVAAMSTGCPFEVLPSCTSAPGACDFRITPRYWPIDFPPETTRKYGVLRWDPTLGTLRRQTLAPISDVSWVKERVMFADVNGDALPDLFRGRFATTNWEESTARPIAVSNPIAVQYTGAVDTFLYYFGALSMKPEDMHVVVDEDGDGRQELMKQSAGVFKSYTRNRDRLKEWKVLNEVTNQTQTTVEPGTVGPGSLFAQPGTIDLQAGQRVPLDVNADGLKDFLIPVASTGEFQLRVNTGAGYTPPTRLSTDPAVIDALRPYAVAGDEGGRAARSGLIPVDWNGDGRDDLLLLGATTGGTPVPMPGGSDSFTYVRTDAIRVLLGRPSGFAPPVALPTGGLHRIYTALLGWTSIKVAELDGNFLPELVAFVREGTTGSRRRLMTLQRMNRAQGVDLITSVDNVRGNDVETISYDSMSAGSQQRLAEPDVHTSDTYGTELDASTTPPTALHLPCAYPATCVARGNVVRLRTDRLSPGRITKRYSYAGARSDVTGRGSLGFRKMTVTDVANGEIVATRYAPVISHGSVDAAVADYHAYPGLLQPTSVKRKVPFSASISPTLSALTDAPVATKLEVVPTFSTGRPIHMTRSINKLKVLEEVGHLGEPPPLSDERERARNEVEIVYDSFGNETSRVARTYDIGINVSTETLLERTTTTTSYQNVAADWLISLPNRRTTFFETRGAPNGACSTFPCDVKTQVVDHVFDTKGLLKDLIREPGGAVNFKLTTTFGRDAAGLVRSVTLRDSSANAATTQRLTEIDYDAFGHHERVTRNAEGHISWFLYDQRLDRLAVETDPNLVSIYYQYDRFGRLRERRDDRGPVNRLSYGNDFVREEDVGGAKRTLFFDVAGNTELVAWSTLAGAAASQNSYDRLGNLRETRYKATTDAYATVSATAGAARGRANAADSVVTMSAVYDRRNRPTSLRRGADLPVTTTYKGLGETWIEQGTGISAHQRRMYRSATGRVREVRDRYVTPTGTERWLSTTYEYEALGELARVTDPKGQVDRFSFDQLGRRTSRDAPATKSIQTIYSYSAFGDLIGLTDGVNNLTFTYDRLGRLDQRRHANGTLLADLTWDQGSGAIGKLSRALGGSGHDVSYGYDSRGRPSGETHTIGQGRLSTVVTYDANGQLDTLQYPETASTDNPLRTRATGLKIKYLYTNGQTSAIQNVTTGTPVTLWTVNERHAMGMLQKATEGSRVATWTYKPDTLRLEGISGTGFTGTQPSLALQYGPTGMLQSRTISGVVETFDHDTLRRLWRHQRIASSSSPMRLVGVDYTYDDAGNVTRADTTQLNQSVDWPNKDYDYVYNTSFPQRLQHLRASATEIRELRYDNAGRQIEDQPNTTLPAFRRTTYNEHHLPSRIEQMLNATTPDTSRPAVTFDYDAFGGRVRRTQASDVLLYVNGLYVRRQNQSHFFVFSEDGPVAEIRQVPGGATTTVFPYHDHLGSRVITSTGGTPETQGHFPYGQRWFTGTPPADTFSVGFTGHERDDDLGLVNMQGRIYDPTQSRFLTPDPMPLPAQPGGMNPYSYALNSPLNNTDPNGFQALPTQGSEPIYVWVFGPSRNDAERANAASQAMAMQVMQMRALQQQQDNAMRQAMAQSSGPPGIVGQNMALRALAAALRALGRQAPATAPGMPSGPEYNPLDYSHGVDPLTGAALGPGAFETGSKWLAGSAVVTLGVGAALASGAPAALGAATTGVGGVGSVGAMRAGEKLLNWSWNSRPTFQHTFLTHGQGAANARNLLGRAAGTGQAQGQWLNNQTAAQFLSGHRPYLQGPSSVPIPPGLGQVILPNGTIVPATHATLIPNAASGGFVTAFPIP